MVSGKGKGAPWKWCNLHGRCKHSTADCWDGGHGTHYQQEARDGREGTIPASESQTAQAQGPRPKPAPVIRPCYFCKTTEHTTTTCPRAVSEVSLTCFNCGKLHSLEKCPEQVIPSVVWFNKTRFQECKENDEAYVWAMPKGKTPALGAAMAAQGSQSSQSSNADDGPELTLQGNKKWTLHEMAQLCPEINPTSMKAKGTSLKLGFTTASECSTAFKLLREREV